MTISSLSSLCASIITHSPLEKTARHPLSPELEAAVLKASLIGSGALIAAGLAGYRVHKGLRPGLSGNTDHQLREESAQDLTRALIANKREGATPTGLKQKWMEMRSAAVDSASRHPTSTTLGSALLAGAFAGVGLHRRVRGA